MRYGTYNPIRGLYNWVLSWAEHPAGTLALFLLAVAESCFFPIPPDLLLIALALGATSRSFFYALVCSIGSVMGGVVGYTIGWQLWGAVSDFFLDYIISQDSFNYVSQMYRENAFLAVLGAAFTPIPYKVFTITAGVCNVNLGIFVFASSIGRSARFFMLAAFMYFVGPKAKGLIDRYFNWFTFILFALVALGFIILKVIS